MSTDTLVAEPTRKPRRQVAKSTARQAVKPIKTAVTLSPETMRRLVITAAMEGKTQSEVVAALIDEYCRRYVVQDRARAASVDIADQATQGVSAAA